MNEYEKALNLLNELGSNSRGFGEGLTCAVGPCAIESAAIVEECADMAAMMGARYLRGGAFKLRTHPNSYHGPGATGWQQLALAARRRGLLTVSEIVNVESLDDAIRWVDVLQIGARSMWNHPLLAACAKVGKPVLLKRGLGALTSEWLAAAVRLRYEGADEVYLCERGNIAHGVVSRNSVDLSTLLVLLKHSKVPVWLDVSHTAGHPAIALDMLSLAPYLGGLSCVMLEIHPDPNQALCDGNQAVSIPDLREWIIRRGDDPNFRLPGNLLPCDHNRSPTPNETGNPTHGSPFGNEFHIDLVSDERGVS